MSFIILLAFYLMVLFHIWKLLILKNRLNVLINKIWLTIRESKSYLLLQVRISYRIHNCANIKSNCWVYYKVYSLIKEYQILFTYIFSIFQVMHGIWYLKNNKNRFFINVVQLYYWLSVEFTYALTLCK